MRNIQCYRNSVGRKWEEMYVWEEEIFNPLLQRHSRLLIHLTRKCDHLWCHAPYYVQKIYWPMICQRGCQWSSLNAQCTETPASLRLNCSAFLMLSSRGTDFRDYKHHWLSKGCGRALLTCHFIDLILCIVDNCVWGMHQSHDHKLRLRFCCMVNLHKVLLFMC